MAALKIAAVCMLVLCVVGSDLARPAVCRASPSPEDQQQEAAADGAGEVCTPACQNCLIICGITCVLNPSPATCFANCTVANGCFSKTMLPVA